MLALLMLELDSVFLFGTALEYIHATGTSAGILSICVL
jgi:hypothetical protein